MPEYLRAVGAGDDDQRGRWAAGEQFRLSPVSRVRLAFRALGLIAALLFAVPIHYVWRTIHYGSPMPMWFLRVAARLSGARTKVFGTPRRRNVIFVSNHLSWVDIPVIAGRTGCAFVAKAELASVPVVGWLARLNRTVFVSRESRMAVADQAGALREALLDAWSVTIFPEGTTTDGHSLLPFKSSMLSALEPPPEGILVQPVVLDYGAMSEWIGWVGNEHGAHNAKRILARRGSYPVGVHFLEPFDPLLYGSRKGIAAEARRRVEAKLIELRGGRALRAFAHDVGSVRYAAPESVAA